MKGQSVVHGICGLREKAYDNVNRIKLWKVLEEYDVKGRLLKAVQAMYEDGKASVRVGDRVRVVWDVQGCEAGLHTIALVI